MESQEQKQNPDHRVSYMSVRSTRNKQKRENIGIKNYLLVTGLGESAGWKCESGKWGIEWARKRKEK